MFATKFLPHSLSPRKQCQYLKLIVYSNILPYFQSSSFDHESEPRTGLAWRQWQRWCGRFPFGSATPTVEIAMGLRWISLKCGGLRSSVTGSAMGLSLFFSFFLRFRLLLCSVWFLLLGTIFFSSYDFSFNINSFVLEAQNRTCGKITLMIFNNDIFFYSSL